MKQSENYISVLLIIVLGFNIISIFFKIPVLFFIGTGIGFVGILFPFVGKIIAKIWMTIAHFLGKINTTILLSIVFFILLFPLAIVRKVFSKKDFLHLKKPSNSNFILREKTFIKEDFEKMW